MCWTDCTAPLAAGGAGVKGAQELPPRVEKSPGDFLLGFAGPPEERALITLLWALLKEPAKAVAVAVAGAASAELAAGAAIAGAASLTAYALAHPIAPRDASADQPTEGHAAPPPWPAPGSGDAAGTRNPAVVKPTQKPFPPQRIDAQPLRPDSPHASEKDKPPAAPGSEPKKAGQEKAGQEKADPEAPAAKKARSTRSSTPQEQRSRAESLRAYWELTVSPYLHVALKLATSPDVMERLKAAQDSGNANSAATAQQLRKLPPLTDEEIAANTRALTEQLQRTQTRLDAIDSHTDPYVAAGLEARRRRLVQSIEGDGAGGNAQHAKSSRTIRQERLKEFYLDLADRSPYVTSPDIYRQAVDNAAWIGRSNPVLSSTEKIEAHKAALRDMINLGPFYPERLAALRELMQARDQLREQTFQAEADGQFGRADGFLRDAEKLTGSISQLLKRLRVSMDEPLEPSARLRLTAWANELRDQTERWQRQLGREDEPIVRSALQLRIDAARNNAQMLEELLTGNSREFRFVPAGISATAHRPHRHVWAALNYLTLREQREESTNPRMRAALKERMDLNRQVYELHPPQAQR